MPARDLPRAMTRARVAHDRVVTASFELLLACEDIDALMTPRSSAAWRETADLALALARAWDQAHPYADGEDRERQGLDAAPGNRTVQLDARRLLGELGDHVVRSAFQAGLQLQSLLSVGSEPVRSRLEGVVDSLDDLIREVRQVMSLMEE